MYLLYLTIFFHLSSKNQKTETRSSFPEVEGGRLGAHSARCLGLPTKGHLEAKLQDKGGDTSVQEGPSAVRVSERCGNTAANEERQEAGTPPWGVHSHLQC